MPGLYASLFNWVSIRVIVTLRNGDENMVWSFCLSKDGWFIYLFIYLFFDFLNEFAILNKKNNWKNAKATQIISIILIKALVFAI